MPVWLGILWASPNSLIGLALAVCSLARQGTITRRGATIEASGPLIAWVLAHLPFLRYAPSAMTLGHVILARTDCDLERCRAHELVHVEQFARWGPFFLPAYGLATFLAWRRGQDPYFDNRFEREAYAKESVQ